MRSPLLFALLAGIAGVVIGRAMPRDTSAADALASASPSSSPEVPQRTPTAEEIRRNRELLDSYAEAVIVQHPDGTTGVYRPEEWPTDGDGVIVARKLPSGEIGWYAGPEAGPRSDPAAFRRLELPAVTPPTLVRGSDGTLQVNGKPGAPALQRMFPGTPSPGAP
ncbi:hypothetical protein [Sorangium sp. So ce854]|uniref:hypothetical protein n=1 Tax=Sorangium sp. So ce854 TaxID=3133322 RepID=UPI003F5E7D9D